MVEPPGPTLESLKALGAARLDPVRWRYLEALARRAASRQGALRQALDARLDRALAACAAHCREASVSTPPAAAPASRSRTSPSPLADLLRRLDRPAPSALSTPGLSPSPPRAELRALQALRDTWARLHTEAQLARSQDELPLHPGPLNSQLLALRAMQQMQALSPAYLQRFMAQVETLLWLDAADYARPVPAPPGRRSGPSTAALPAPARRKRGR